MDAPHFFVDRSLGRVQVPRLLRADGWILTTLAGHYGRPRDETVADVAWLALCGRRSWAVLMKDEKIRYRTVERDALISSGVTAFCLASGNLRSADMASTFIDHRAAIWSAAHRGGAAIYVVSRSGPRLTAL